MRYEDRLAALFTKEKSSLILIAMAHVGGFADRLQGWLSSARKQDAYAPIWLRDFDALLTSDVQLIEASFLNADRLNKLSGSSSAYSLDIDLGRIADPLILIGALTSCRSCTTGRCSDTAQEEIPVHDHGDARPRGGIRMGAGGTDFREREPGECGYRHSAQL